jgi:hypothetical protein
VSDLQQETERAIATIKAKIRRLTKLRDAFRSRSDAFTRRAAEEGRNANLMGEQLQMLSELLGYVSEIREESKEPTP